MYLHEVIPARLRSTYWAPGRQGWREVTSTWWQWRSHVWGSSTKLTASPQVRGLEDLPYQATHQAEAPTRVNLMARLGARLGNWNDRVNTTGDRTAGHPRRWRALDRVARWLYAWGRH